MHQIAHHQLAKVPVFPGFIQIPSSFREYVENTLDRCFGGFNKMPRVQFRVSGYYSHRRLPKSEKRAKTESRRVEAGDQIYKQAVYINGGMRKTWHLPNPFFEVEVTYSPFILPQISITFNSRARIYIKLHVGGESKL